MGHGRSAGVGATVRASASAWVDPRRKLRRAGTSAGLRVQYTSIIADRSDHASFAAEGVEAAALFTGFHPDYHKASDIASRVNYAGLAQIVDVAEAIARAEADR
ncbi:MAG TPA: M28 family peptidase [Gemmatimonadaceae bacterium]|nr:M28 family peptidase [Gemmatimonadaceae bacterium]